MNFRQLKAFTAVMDSGLISKAAAEIGVTQPAVSKIIKSIEDELGVRLFERTRGRLFPTPEAFYLRNVANSVLSQLNEATRFLQDYGNMKAGDLRILSIPGPSLFFLPRLINQFVPSISQINASLLSWSSSSIVNWISNHQSGVGLVELYDSNPFLNVEVINFRCVCAMSRSHRLATQDVITPGDLKAENLALIVSEHPLYSEIENIFRASGCAMNVKFQSDLFVPQFSMLEERDLIAIIDPINMRNYEIYSNGAGTLVFHRFEPEVCLRLSVISPSLRPLSGLENEFKTVLISELLKIRDVR